MYRTYFSTLWEKMRVGCFKRTAWKHVYHLWWNRSPAQVGCMRQVLRPAVLGRPREVRWRGRWERGSGWGIHVNPRLIHVNVWQKKTLQHYKVISLQLIKINGKKKEKSLKKKKKLSLSWSNHFIPWLRSFLLGTSFLLCALPLPHVGSFLPLLISISFL